MNRSRHELKAIRFEGELLPDWAQLFDLASRLSGTPTETQNWFSRFTNATGADSVDSIIAHAEALRSSLQDNRESVIHDLRDGSGDSDGETIVSAWMYALDTIIQTANDKVTCDWEVEGTDDGEGYFGGGQVSIRRI